MIVNCNNQSPFISVSLKYIIVSIAVVIGLSAQGHNDVSLLNIFFYLFVIVASWLVFIVISISNYNQIASVVSNVFIAFTIFTLLSLSRVLSENIPLESFYGVYFNYFLLFTGMLLGCVIVSVKDGDRLLIDWLFLAAALNSIYVFFSYLISGGNIFEARYYIVGSLLPFMFIPFIAKYCVERREDVATSYFYNVMLFFAVVIVLISKTRTYIFCVFGVYLIFSILIRRKSPINPRLIMFFSLLFLSFSPLLVISELHQSITAFLDRFMLIGTAEDFTSITRVAEYSYQINQLLSSVARFFLGCGIGQQYGYDDRYYVLLQDVFTADEYNQQGGISFGHSLYVYSVYSSGFVLFAYFFVKIVILLINMCRFRNEILKNYLDTSLCLIFFLFLVLGFFISPLGARDSVFVFGVTFGALMYRYHKKFN